MEDKIIAEIKRGVYCVRKEKGEISFYGVYDESDFTAIIPLVEKDGDYEFVGSWDSVIWINRPIGRIVYEDFLNRGLTRFNDGFERIGGFRRRLEEIVRENDKDAEILRSDKSKVMKFNDGSLIYDNNFCSNISGLYRYLGWFVAVCTIGAGIGYLVGEYFKRK